MQHVCLGDFQLTDHTFATINFTLHVHIKFYLYSFENNRATTLQATARKRHFNYSIFELSIKVNFELASTETPHVKKCTNAWQFDVLKTTSNSHVVMFDKSQNTYLLLVYLQCPSCLCSDKKWHFKNETTCIIIQSSKASLH